MTETQTMAERLNRCLPDVKTGSLCFWGKWFGRPYDNIHRIVSCEAEEDLLKVTFDQGEVLSVWSPLDLEAHKDTFCITDARRVRWQWFYYGRPKTEDNHCFLDFMKTRSEITLTTNADRSEPDLQVTLDAPAVKMF